MKYVVFALVVLLLMLHQDYWQWDNRTLVFGFLPYSIAYHVCISLAAAAVAWLATRYCWPAELDSADARHSSPPTQHEDD